MTLYDILQIGHIFIFGILLAHKKYSPMSRWLVFSAVFYLLFPSNYLLDAVFDFFIAYQLIRIKIWESKIQQFLLYILCIYSCLSWVEFPTERRLFYDNYATITNGLNFLQLLVMGNGIRDIGYYIHTRVDFNARIAYNLFMENYRARWRMVEI